MKVLCASCRTRYWITMELPAGCLVETECKRCSAPITARAPSLRSIAPTLAATPFPAMPFADSSGSLDGVGDLAMPPAGRLAWCVDDGGTLTTKTSFELWVAIASGDVGRDVRVWREGIECWEAIEHVPELSCALPEAPPSLASAPSRPVAIATHEETPAAWECVPEPAPSLLPARGERSEARQLLALLGSDPLGELDRPSVAGALSARMPLASVPAQRTAAVAPVDPPAPVDALRARAHRLPRAAAGARSRWVAAASAAALLAFALAASRLASAGGAASSEASALGPASAPTVQICPLGAPAAAAEVADTAVAASAPEPTALDEGGEDGPPRVDPGVPVTRPRPVALRHVVDPGQKRRRSGPQP